MSPLYKYTYFFLNNFNLFPKALLLGEKLVNEKTFSLILVGKIIRYFIPPKIPQTAFIDRIMYQLTENKFVS